MGLRTWGMTLDRDDKLKDDRKIFTEENCDRIGPGMRKGDMRRMRGKPRTGVVIRARK
jgi:hypothetical protein